MRSHDLHIYLSFYCRFVDFTRLKMVQGKKEQQMAEDAKMHAKMDAVVKLEAPGKENDATAAFEDDDEVVF